MAAGMETLERDPPREHRATRRHLPNSDLLLVGLVLLGLALRIREYVFDRSLWLDEIALADSLTTRGFEGLTKPLAAGQAAPLGFLWLERVSIDVFGTSELALRVVPLLGGLISVLLFALVARRLMPGPAAVAATFLFAVTPELLFYSSEVKQYSTDVTATLALVWWTLLLRRPPGWRGATLWGAGAGALVWLSQPAIPVACVCALVIALSSVRRPRGLLELVPGGAILGASILLEYVTFLRTQSNSALLQAYWHLGYPPRPVRVSTGLPWLRSDARSVLTDPMRLASPEVVGLLALVGLGYLLARRRLLGAGLLVSPIVLGVILAVAHLYPLRQRLALYLFPLVLLLLAAGLLATPRGPWPSGLARGTGRVGAWAVALLVAAGLVLVSGAGVARGVTVLGRPIDITAGREAVQYVAQHQEPGDVVIDDRAWSTPTLVYYGPKYGVDDTFSVAFAASRGHACDPVRALSLPAGTTRVWLVLAHHASSEPVDRTAVFRSNFAQLGTPLLDYHGAGDAGAYLYDVAERPVSPPPLVPSWIRGDCLTLVRGP